MFRLRIARVVTIARPNADLRILFGKRGISWILQEIFFRNESLTVHVDDRGLAVYQKHSVQFVGAKRVFNVGDVHDPHSAEGAHLGGALPEKCFGECNGLRRSTLRLHLREKTVIGCAGIVSSAFFANRGKDLRRWIPDNCGPHVVSRNLSGISRLLGQQERAIGAEENGEENRALHVVTSPCSPTLRVSESRY